MNKITVKEKQHHYYYQSKLHLLNVMELIKILGCYTMHISKVYMRMTEPTRLTNLPRAC